MHEFDILSQLCCWNNTETEEPNKRHKCETNIFFLFFTFFVSFSVLFIPCYMQSLLFVGNLFLAVQSIIKQNMTRCSVVVAIMMMMMMIIIVQANTRQCRELNKTKPNRIQTKNSQMHDDDDVADVHIFACLTFYAANMYTVPSSLFNFTK